MQKASQPPAQTGARVAIAQVSKNLHEIQVKSHDVTFQMRVLSVDGAPAKDESSLYKKTNAAEVDMFLELPLEVKNWRFIDNYDVECSRLELCQMEYGDDPQLPEGTPLCDITVVAEHEIPLTREHTSEARPISVEHLVEEVPALLQSIFRKHGVELELHKVKYYKTMSFRDVGEYAITSEKL